MNVKEGNLWDALLLKSNNAIVVPTNSELDGYNRLVMGAGFARQVKERYSLAPALLGKQIRNINKQVYGVAAIKHYEPWIIAFQTKIHWMDKSRLDVIGYSCIMLQRFINKHKHIQHFHMAYPGIGLGGIPEPLIQPIIMHLPVKVTVWKYVETDGN